MSFYPPITLTFLNGFLLMLPLLVLRFCLPAFVDKKALAALDHFPPPMGRERFAMRVYLVSNTFLIFSPLVALIRGAMPWSLASWLVYFFGLVVLVMALYTFSQASGNFVMRGLYRWSRNPIYLGYFFIFLGMSLIIGSWMHVALTLVYQVSVHYLVLSEERWCRKNFGKQYEDYQRRVRRYL